MIIIAVTGRAHCQRRHVGFHVFFNPNEDISCAANKIDRPAWQPWSLEIRK